VAIARAWYGRSCVMAYSDGDELLRCFCSPGRARFLGATPGLFTA
jgi:hypothetical protein